MKRRKKIRCIVTLLLLGISVLFFLGLSVCIGTVRISLREIFSSLQGQRIPNERILWDIRMPRALAAMLLGGALALSGYLLQTFFHNPIAGPFVLGISSGAKMLVAVVMVFAVVMSESVQIVESIGSVKQLRFVEFARDE